MRQIFLKKPSEDFIKNSLKLVSNDPYSYPEIGATQKTPPRNYNIDHYRCQLGQGRVCFEGAKQAIRDWEMFNLGWVKQFWKTIPIIPGEITAILIKAMGFWHLNFCRIVYVIEEGGELEKFGFAYGTLQHHAEKGEERFLVEWDHANDCVFYDIMAFSQPRSLASRIFYPYVRQLQKRFGKDSQENMLWRLKNNLAI